MTDPLIPTLDEAWFDQIGDIIDLGRETSPRGKLTKELPSKQLVFDMNFPVLTNPLRELGYKFMAAEAWWILDGRDDVESIAPYAKHIVNFSDDGHKFFGAYGPRIASQLDYVVNSLLADGDTRQAVLTTWQPNPPRTKDVPCTVAFDWLLRDHKLELHVFMRSSDNWLGVPYDSFNFSMLTVEIVRRLNLHPLLFQKPIGLGTCYLTAGSSHLYEPNFEAVEKVLNTGIEFRPMPVPKSWYDNSAPTTVTERLCELKDTAKGDPRRWWEG